MLRCKDIHELATEYQEGALPLRRRLAVWVHLRLCDACRIFVAQLETTRRLLGRLPRAEIQPEDEVELLRQLRRPPGGP